MDLDKQFVKNAVLLGHLTQEEAAELLIQAGKGRPGVIGRHLVRTDRLSRDQVLEIYRHVGYIPCPRCSHTVTLSTASVLECVACARKFRLPADPSTNFVGRTFGDYQITAKIGQGGMGDLYRAVHPGLDKTFALKVIAPECVRNQSFLERFRREARIAAKVDHPNTIGIITVGQEGGLHYIVMPLVDGEDLAHHVDRNGPLAPKAALAVLIQLVRGLQAIHEAGILHRDIKPDNVLVDRSGKVLLGDFGLAREAAGASLTQTGVILGTPQYMSPEQCDGTEVDQRSDLYNLGVTYYFLLHGKPPFDEESPMAVMLKQKTQPLPVSRSVARDAGPQQIAVLARMTAKRPADRYQSAEELLADLWALQEGRAPRARIRPAAGKARWPWAAAGLGLVAVLLGLAQGRGWWGGGHSSQPPVGGPTTPAVAEQESLAAFVARHFDGRAELVDAARLRVRIRIDRWEVNRLERIASWQRTRAEMLESPERLVFTSLSPESGLTLRFNAVFRGPLAFEAAGRFRSSRPGAHLGFQLFQRVVRGADRALFLGLERGAQGLTLFYQNSWPGTQGPVKEHGPRVALDAADAFQLAGRAQDGAYRIDLGRGAAAPTVAIGGPLETQLSGAFGLLARGFSRLELERLVCEGELDRQWVGQQRRAK